MEFRELKYFLEVAREGNISRAAQNLFVTQPNLSRQMQNLERRLGRTLFKRGNRKITLTAAGIILKKRAEEILELYERTEAELSAPTKTVCGNVYLGAGESRALYLVAEPARRLRDSFPLINFHIYSADTPDVAERLDKGLLDFGVLIEPADLSGYEFLRLPLKDSWGVLMRKDDKLAEKEAITPEDLARLPLIRSKHSLGGGAVADWFQKREDELNVVASYNLMYNASLLVKAGVGYAVGLCGIINTEGSSLCFRPLKPELKSDLDLVWKRGRPLSAPAEKFLEFFRGAAEFFS